MRGAVRGHGGTLRCAWRRGRAAQARRRAGAARCARARTVQRGGAAREPAQAQARPGLELCVNLLVLPRHLVGGQHRPRRVQRGGVDGHAARDRALQLHGGAHLGARAKRRTTEQKEVGRGDRRVARASASAQRGALRTAAPPAAWVCFGPTGAGTHLRGAASGWCSSRGGESARARASKVRLGWRARAHTQRPAQRRTVHPRHAHAPAGARTRPSRLYACVFCTRLVAL